MRAFRAALPVLLVCCVTAGCGSPPKAAEANAARSASLEPGGDAAPVTPASVAMTPKGAPQRADG